MFFVYLNIQFTSFHEHAAPHEHVGLLKHNKLNLPLVLGECQMLFIPDIVQFSFRATIHVEFDNEWVWNFIKLSDEFWMSI